jgi:exopolysaccharide biosynthesis protein
VSLTSVPPPGRAALAASLALGLVLSAAPQEPLKERPDIRRAVTVAAGIEHIEIERGDLATAGTDRWTINALVLDPERARLVLARALDEGVGTETTSSMAARHGALAAVNGGYFRTAGLYRGEPAGFMALAGKILSEPSRKRPGLAVTNAEGRISLAVVDIAFRAEIAAAKGARREVNGVNRPRLANETIVFTPEFHGTTLTGPAGVEAVVVGGRVVSVADKRGSTMIPEDGWVISGHGDSAVWLRANLRRGTRVELTTETVLSPRPSFVADYVLGGGPRLVRGGKPAADADPGIYDPGFTDARHPRTAVGTCPDGRILLVTVDGRQPGKSVGMTIAELSDLLIELGAAQAVNLDGGGSTTMVVGGRVVNSPSDPTGERPVGDALLVLPR